MNINELKEHLENGGKIRRPGWGKNAYVYLDDDGELSQEDGLLYYSNKDLLLDDWEVYGKPKKKEFEITHTGLYKTRDGRMAFVSFVSNFDFGIFGVIDGENLGSRWSENGKSWNGEESPVDIVAEWKED
jgi:hypothetical protein